MKVSKKWKPNSPFVLSVYTGNSERQTIAGFLWYFRLWGFGLNIWLSGRRGAEVAAFGTEISRRIQRRYGHGVKSSKNPKNKNFEFRVFLLFFLRGGSPNWPVDQVFLRFRPKIRPDEEL